MSSVTERSGEVREVRSGLVRRVFRFGANAVLATVCSQTTFILVYGPLRASTTVASTLAWLAGAIPNYWLNRSWTWGRRGRPSVRHEILPYVAIVLGTLGLAILATGVGARLLDQTSLSPTTQTFLVWAIYFSVYVVMFAFRFLLFDRLFRTGPQAPAEPSRPGPT